MVARWGVIESDLHGRCGLDRAPCSLMALFDAIDRPARADQPACAGPSAILSCGYSAIKVNNLDCHLFVVDVS